MKNLILIDNSLVSRNFDNIKYWFINFEESVIGVGSQLITSFFCLSAAPASLMAFDTSCAIFFPSTWSKLTVFSSCKDSTGGRFAKSFFRGLRSSMGLAARTFFGNCFVEYWIQNVRMKRFLNQYFWNVELLLKFQLKTRTRAMRIFEMCKHDGGLNFAQIELYVSADRVFSLLNCSFGFSTAKTLVFVYQTWAN